MGGSVSTASCTLGDTQDNGGGWVGLDLPNTDHSDEKQGCLARTQRYYVYSNMSIIDAAQRLMYCCVVPRSWREKRRFAARMRANPTLGEAKVWEWLRHEPFRGMGWKRQQLVCGYIVDFLCPSRNLVIEVDGSVHSKPDVMAWDQTRNLVLANIGYTVIHVGNFVQAKELRAKIGLPRQQPDRRQRRKHERRGWVLSPLDKALKVQRALEAAGLSASVPRGAEVKKTRRRVGSAGMHEPPTNSVGT